MLTKIVSGIKRLFSKLKLRITFLYYQYYVLPEISPTENGKQVRYIHAAYNTIHILTDNFFYKIALRDPNTVKLEYENYQFAHVNYIEFRKYLPLVSFHQIRKFSFLKIEKLTPIADSVENQQVALKILSCLKKYGSARKVELSDFPFVEEGLQVTREQIKEDDWAGLYNFVRSYLETNSFLTGPVHNDFHSNNIMRNSAGEPKVIDFDCFKDLGIQIIDSLYYQIEKQAQVNGYPTTPYLLDYCQDDLSGMGKYVEWTGDRNALSVLYYLNRMGQEYSLFGIKSSGTEILKLIPTHV